MSAELGMDLSPHEMAALRAVGKSFALLRREAERNVAAQSNMTRAQFEILGNLAAAPDGLRMFELADQLVLSRSTLTYHVTQLVDAGLVTREGGTPTQRAVVVQITQAGVELTRKLRNSNTDIIRKHFINSFSAEELAIVTAGFERVVESFGDAAADIRPRPHDL